MTIRIPPFLHDILGESQTIGELLAIAVLSLGITTTLFVAFSEMTWGLPIWRSTLAYLLVLDIVAGCVANFTRSTSNHYASRSKERWIFIAIHLHLLLVAGLLKTGFLHAAIVWGYTIARALTVNALKGNRFQLFTAGSLLVAGIAIAVLGVPVPNYFLVISLLFMMKVLFSFAVDHYHQTDIVES
jgi:hypothetical protein